MSPDTSSALRSRLHPLCLGGNVFGWTVGPDDAAAVLDAYADRGGTFIDTATSTTGESACSRPSTRPRPGTASA